MILLLALASAASAQTSVGVFGGPAFFTVAGGDSDAHLGPAVGVALDVILSKKVALALRPGFHEKGAWDVGVAHFGGPVLLRYPASAGPYVAGGFELTFRPGDSRERETALALTGGAGVRYGSGRVWGFLEARYSWDPHGGRDDFVTASASIEPCPPPGCPNSSASPSYRGVVIVGAVMLRLGSKRDRPAPGPR